MSFYVFKKVMGNGFIRGAVPPVDKALQWIDTSGDKPNLKYFKDETQTWEELTPEDIPNQKDKLGVVASNTAPKEVTIPILPTPNFAVKSIQVLKLIPALTNVTKTQMQYNNTDSTNFIYDDEFINFDGTMHLKTDFSYDLVNEGNFGTGSLLSYSFEKNKFKKIANMEVV